MLDTSLIFDHRDSGHNGHRVIYKSLPGEKAVISGAEHVTGWQPDANGRWKARVSIGDCRQLYVNNVRAIRARGPCPKGIKRFGNLESIDSEAGYLFPKGDMADWDNPNDIELGHYSSWSHMTAKVGRITRDLSGRSVVYMLQPWFFLVSRKEGRQAETPNYIENALELLDEPGEWYFDRSEGIIYYIPREEIEMDSAEVLVPVLESLVRLEGTLDRPVQNISLKGLTFADATWLRPNRVGHPDVQANFIIHPSNLYERGDFMVNVQDEYLKSPANVVLHAARNCRFVRQHFPYASPPLQKVCHLHKGNGDECDRETKVVQPQP